jgi:hypothetical protein
MLRRSSKGAIREAVGFLSKVIDQVESIDFEIPSEIAAHMANLAVLAVVDKVMGKDTSTIIARPTVNIGTIWRRAEGQYDPGHLSL